MTSSSMGQSKSLQRLARHGGTLKGQQHSIGNRLFWTVMGGVTLGLGSLSFGFYQNLQSKILQQAATRLNVEVTALDGQLQGGESFLKSLAAATVGLKSSGASTPEAYEQLVRSFMQARPKLITGFGIMQTPQGLVSNSTWYGPYIEESVPGRGTVLPNNSRFSFVDLEAVDHYPTQDYFKTPLASGKLMWTKPYVTDGYPIPLTTFGGPIRNAQGQTIAVLNGDVSLLDLQKIAQRTVVEGSGYYVAMTAEGNLLAQPPAPKQTAKQANKPSINALNLTNASQIAALKPVWQQVQKQLATGKASGRVTVDAGNYWFYQQVPTTKWIVLANVPLAAVTSPALIAAFGGTMLVAILTAGIVALFVRSLNQRLNPILEACQQLATSESAPQLTEEMDELEKLSVSFFGLLDQQNQFLAEQVAEVNRAETMRNIVVSLSQAISLEAVLLSAAYNIQQVIEADRVLIYQWQPDGSGKIVQQITHAPWPSLPAETTLPFLRAMGLEADIQGQPCVVDDASASEIPAQIQQQAQALNIQASLVVPIFSENQPWGLVVLHQCAAPRTWQPLEVELFSQIATQVGLSVERAALINKTEELAQERLQDKETIQNQLIQLLTSIEGAAMGDLTVRADITEGEIGTVGDFFNAIVESLRNIVTQVKQSAEQVNSSVSSNEVAIRQLADEALQQVTEINQTLNSVESMTQAMQTVAFSAQQASDVARAASSTAVTGESAMESSVASILNLRSTIAETSKKVKRLGESSQQISKAVVLINQLATKTKLLAINASIEAALAGETGQGFAVVAEEVGQLAAQSSAATQDIAKIVDGIQQEVSEVVLAMEEGTLQVVEGTRLVEETRQSLGQVLDVSRQIDALVASISSATTAQVATSETVTHLMQQIASQSQQTAGTSQKVSDALQETVTVTEQLQASMDTFKL